VCFDLRRRRRCSLAQGEEGGGQGGGGGANRSECALNISSRSTLGRIQRRPASAAAARRLSLSKPTSCYSGSRARARSIVGKLFGDA
jgi:hypothetical protein